MFYVILVKGSAISYFIGRRFVKVRAYILLILLNRYWPFANSAKEVMFLTELLEVLEVCEISKLESLV